MNSSCVIRVDAGAKWGIGHFRRCLPLARAMKARGFRILFVMVKVPDALREAGQSLQFEMVEYPRAVDPGSKEDQLFFKQCLPEEKYDWIVFDGYHYDRAYRESISSIAERTLIIQDVPGDYGDADLFLDQNVNTNLSLYTFRPGGRLLMGPEFSLTTGDQRLRKLRKNQKNKPLRILITLGGADVKQLSLPVARALEKLDVALDVVLGSESGWHLKDFRDVRGSVTIHEAPDGIDHLLAAADIGIMSLGITTWEMCFYGLPFVMLASNLNQQRVIDWFTENDLADDGLKNGCFDAAYLRQSVTRLLGADVIRRNRSEKLMRIVDGKGPDRLVDAMQEYGNG